MNAALETTVVQAPSKSTTPFDNNIDMRTKEEISVWKTATDPDILLDRTALTVEKVNNFPVRMNSKCYDF